MKKTTKTFPTLMNKYGQILTENDIKFLYNYCDEHYYEMDANVRINHCQAYYTHVMYIKIDEKTNFYVNAIFVKSYKTYVAVFLPEFGILISFGRYSMTTYQHIRKFRDNFCAKCVQEYNMEYVSNFG